MDTKTLLQDGDISKDDEELIFDPYNKTAIFPRMMRSLFLILIIPKTRKFPNGRWKPFLKDTEFPTQSIT